MMEDLIKKLEAATEGSRELDGDIVRAILPKGKPFPLIDPPYTTSIDAALTLVPEGWHVKRLENILFVREGRWLKFSPDKWGITLAFSDLGVPYIISVSSTPDLAIVIAALKAHPTGDRA